MAVNEALPFDEPEDDVAVARAEPAHGPQAVEDGPLSMWMRPGRPDATKGHTGASSGSVERWLGKRRR